MALELTGTVKQINPTESGEGKNGQWRKKSFLLEYMDGNYPKIVEIQGMNKAVDYIEKLGEGETTTVHFNVESREYNGRYYTECKLWKTT